MTLARLLLVFTVLALLLGCDGKNAVPEPPKRDRPLVVTTFFPTYWLARELAGDAVDLELVTPDDSDPIHWKPDADTLAHIQSADLIVLNGADLELWTKVASLPSSRTVRTAESFADRHLVYAEAVAHSHGPGGDHVHTGTDGHTWMSPANLKDQAVVLAAALKNSAPAAAPQIDQRLAALSEPIDGLFTAYEALDLGATGYVYASHPAYNYLARDLGWRMVNLDLDPEQMPSDEEFAAVAAKQKNLPGRLLLWESEPLPAIAKRFQDELGLRSVVVSPSEMVPAADLPTADYVELQQANIERLRAALGE